MANYAETPQRRFQCVSPILYILYYGFGLLVVHKYHEIGLRVVCYSFTIFLEAFRCVVCVGVFRPYHRFFPTWQLTQRFSLTASMRQCYILLSSSLLGSVWFGWLGWVSFWQLR